MFYVKSKCIKWKSPSDNFHCVPIAEIAGRNLFKKFILDIVEFGMMIRSFSDMNQGTYSTTSIFFFYMYVVSLCGSKQALKLSGIFSG